MELTKKMKRNFKNIPETLNFLYTLPENTQMIVCRSGKIYEKISGIIGASDKRICKILKCVDKQGITTREYNMAGYLIYLRMSNGYVKIWEYNYAGLIAQIKDSNGSWEKWEYDANLNLKYHTNHTGFWEFWKYNEREILTEYSNSEYKRITYDTVKTFDMNLIEIVPAEKE